jgi:hypothetical protein
LPVFANGTCEGLSCTQDECCDPIQQCKDSALSQCVDSVPDCGPCETDSDCDGGLQCRSVSFSDSEKRCVWTDGLTMGSWSSAGEWVSVTTTDNLFGFSASTHTCHDYRIHGWCNADYGMAYYFSNSDDHFTPGSWGGAGSKRARFNLLASSQPPHTKHPNSGSEHGDPGGCPDGWVVNGNDCGRPAAGQPNQPAENADGCTIPNAGEWARSVAEKASWAQKCVVAWSPQYHWWPDSGILDCGPGHAQTVELCAKIER